jgi:hypothetical protein
MGTSLAIASMIRGSYTIYPDLVVSALPLLTGAGLGLLYMKLIDIRVVAHPLASLSLLSFSAALQR